MRRERTRKTIVQLIFAAILLTIAGVSVIAIVNVAAASDAETQEIYNFDEYTSQYQDLADATPIQEPGPFDLEIDFTGDTPTGTDPTYMLHVNYGYTWVDAEKRPPDDGAGNPPPVLPDEEDDLLCWAATATNILEWTGWGLAGTMENTDEMFQYFMDYWNDTGGWMEYAWHWWFDGWDPGTPRKDVPGGGNFWPGYTFTNYFHKETDDAKVLQAIDDYLRAGYGVGIGIFPSTPPGGHAITVWGFNYVTSDPDYYVGIWVTDSDDSKGQIQPPPAPNRLRYYEVEWNGTHWIMPTYGGWWISEVQALEPFPSTRPVAIADGPHIVDEGSAITFDGSGSGDIDGDPLWYRWDFDPDWTRWDFVWDTGWLPMDTTATNTWFDDHVGDVALQVYDGHMYDIDTATVIVNNVAPTVSAGVDQTVDEGDTVSFSASFFDPGTLDTHTIKWDFGDGSPTVTGTLTPTHVYGDNGVYTVTLTVTDDDGGVGTDTLTVTVNNVAPTVDAGSDQTVDEDDIVSFSGSYTDPGTDDTHTIEWDFGDGTTTTPATLTPTHVYGDDGVYTVTLTVTDDDGGVGTDTLTVTVNNVAPSIDILELAPPNEDNPEFILPVVHEPLFTGEATDVGSDDLTFTWDWGDGSPTNVTIYYNDGVGPDPYPSPGGTHPFSATDTAGHIYALPGTYTVTLTVEDDDGGVDAATYEITVLSAEEAKEIINEYIQNLPGSAFDSKPNKRKRAFANKFAAVDTKLENEDYNGAISQLRSIRAKADGFARIRATDWIIDPVAQEEICMKIDDLIAYLETFL